MRDVFGAGIERHDKAGQRTAIRPAEGVQQQLDEHTVAIDAQQSLVRAVLDPRQYLVRTAERLIAECDFVSGWRVNLDGQRHLVLAAAHHFEDFHQTGFVHDPVMVAALLIKMKAVEFFFFHHQLAVNAAGNLEGFTAAQRKYLVARCVLRQIQVPAKPVTAVQPIERAIRQSQAKARATQIIGLNVGQVD
ncbi:hypothetical protein D3C84_304960 [compost metagenome]